MGRKEGGRGKGSMDINGCSMRLEDLYVGRGGGGYVRRGLEGRLPCLTRYDYTVDIEESCSCKFRC